MKKIILFLLVSFLLTFGITLAQEIPKGSWQVEPSSPEFREDAGRGHWEVRDVQVVWGDDSNLFAHSNHEGAVTNMVFRLNTPGKDTVFFFPTDNEHEKFPVLDTWKKFAEQARNRCRFLTEHMYVDTTPYEFFGKSRVLRDWEFGRGQEHLVFKDGDRLVVVSFYDWEGSEPQKGEKVWVGRHKNHEVFFPVEKVGEKYLIEPRTAEVLAERERQWGKELAEQLAEPKEAPVPTLPTIVVEGRLPDKEK